MFDIPAEQIDNSIGSSSGSSSALGSVYCADDKAELCNGRQDRHTPQLADSALTTFSTIKVLMIETRGDNDSASIVEQCLRYMTGFECQIAQAGSHAAAAFALRSDTFDVVVTDEHCLDLIADNGTATIVITGRPSSETTRKALKVGALHCLPLNDISPRLLETAISQALCCEP